MEIGEILKEARESQSISLESLQESTKIQKRYLEAIEKGNFHILPGTFYTRAFIKEYAYAVGLDADALLIEHDVELPSTEEEKDEEEFSRIERTGKGRASKGPAILSAAPTIIVILLVIGIFFVALTLYQKAINDGSSDPVDMQDDNEIVRDKNEGEQNDQDVDDEKEDEEKEKEEEEKEKEKEKETETALNLVEEGAESTYELVNAGEEVLITLTSEGETWLQVTNEDEKSLYNQLLTEADSPLELDVSEEERVFFNIGFAPDLKIDINGIELEYPGDENQNVVQKLWLDIVEDEE